MISCKFQSGQPAATDKIEAMNGLWELSAVECGDGPSRLWEQQSHQNPVNARRQVNNGQTIDYVVDSSKCLQTSTGHLVSQGNFLFTTFKYQKYCNESCLGRVSDCGPSQATSLARVQIVENEMLVSENDSGICGKSGQPGPVTTRYQKILKL